MVSHGRVELLAHPLSQKYLQMKWNSYGKYYHVANLLIYCVFLVFVTLYSSLLMNNVFDVQLPTVVPLANGTPLNLTENTALPDVFKFNAIKINFFNITTHLPQVFTTAIPIPTSSPILSSSSRRRAAALPLDSGGADPLFPRAPQMVNITTLMCVCTIGILAFVVVNALREMIQVYQQKLHYLFEMNNVVSWFLYTSATIMVSPIFTGGYITDLHYSAASVTVFLSWFNLLLFLQRFDQV